MENLKLRLQQCPHRIFREPKLLVWESFDFIDLLQGLKLYSFFHIHPHCKSKVFARSALYLSILHCFSGLVPKFVPTLNWLNIASLRFADAAAAPPQNIRYFRLVIKSTFSSFDLFLSSESYSLIFSSVIHQANLCCSSVLTYGIAIRACVFGVVRISSSKWRSTTALHGKLIIWYC